MLRASARQRRLGEPVVADETAAGFARAVAALVQSCEGAFYVFQLGLGAIERLDVCWAGHFHGSDRTERRHRERGGARRQNGGGQLEHRRGGTCDGGVQPLP